MRRPPASGARLVQIAWLVNEDELVALVGGLRASGFVVGVSPEQYPRVERPVPSPGAPVRAQRGRPAQATGESSAGPSDAVARSAR